MAISGACTYNYVSHPDVINDERGGVGNSLRAYA